MNAVLQDLTTDGFRMVGRNWYQGAAPTSADDVQDAAVRALLRHGQRATVRAVRDTLAALPRESGAAPAGPAVDDQGLPAPTAEELAEEAAWFVDMFFMFALTFTPDTPWLFGNDDVDCDAVPADVRRTAFRAGMATAAAHGVPDKPPTARQVVNALIRRMAKDRRLKAS